MLWLLLLFILILALSVLFALYCISPFRISSQTFRPELQPKFRNHQRALFETLTQHLQAIDVTFWAVKTTLVDIVENKDLFQDRDILSIAVLRDFDRQLLHLKHHKNLGVFFVLHQVSDGYMCYLDHINDFPCVHISIMDQHDHEIVPCTSRDTTRDLTHSNNHLLRHEIYLTRHVFPLREVSTHNLIVPIPQNAEECARIYKEHTTHVHSWIKLVYNQRTKNIWNNLSNTLTQ